MNPERTIARWPVLVVLALLILITLVFIVEFVVSSETPSTPTPETLDETGYLSTVTPLLVGADPQRGAALVEKYNCIVCHRAGAENGIAPAFTGVAERAATRHPPLSAASYLYESITHPLAYVVADYSPAMPQNFADVLTSAEIGDIIAYLLTPDAH